jgi:hypothetical protein
MNMPVLLVIGMGTGMLVSLIHVSRARASLAVLIAPSKRGEDFLASRGQVEPDLPVESARQATAGPGRHIHEIT